MRSNVQRIGDVESNRKEAHATARSGPTGGPICRRVRSNTCGRLSPSQTTLPRLALRHALRVAGHVPETLSLRGRSDPRRTRRGFWRLAPATRRCDFLDGLQKPCGVAWRYAEIRAMPSCEPFGRRFARVCSVAKVNFLTKRKLHVVVAPRPVRFGCGRARGSLCR